MGMTKPQALACCTYCHTTYNAAQRHTCPICALRPQSTATDSVAARKEKTP
jgi:uncharacterized paraquat-inducible protein A